MTSERKSWDGVEKMHQLRDRLGERIRPQPGNYFSYSVTKFGHGSCIEDNIIVLMKLGEVTFKMALKEDELEDPQYLADLWIQQIQINADLAMCKGEHIQSWKRIVNSIIFL